MKYTATCLTAIVLVLDASQADAQTQLFNIHGTSQPGWVGTSIAPLGDVNGDGVADWLCGDLQYSKLDNGFVLIISGANGSILRSLHGQAQGDEFGWAVASCGDADGDGIPDVVASSFPGDDGNSDADPYVRVYSSATGALLHHIVNGSVYDEFGWALSGVGDVNGDGRGDFAIGQPATNNAWIYSGATGQPVFASLDATGIGGGFGASVAGLDDLDGDGRPEFAVGAASNYYGYSGVGAVRVFRGSNASVVQTLVSNGANDGFGCSVARIADLDGDGRSDLVVGAPSDPTSAPNAGRVYVFSSTTWTAIFDWAAPVGLTRFGRCVADAGDVDADGFHDVLIASSGGAWRVYSGHTGDPLLAGAGPGGSFHRKSVAGLGDLNHDGFDDFAVGFPTSGLAGSILVYSPCPVPPRTYCTAQTNSLGCASAIGWTGTTSLTTGSLHVVATQAFNNKTGILFYGLNGRTTVPFHSGVKCVAGPLRRTDHQQSGGSPTGNDCTGHFDFDFRAHVQSGADPALGVGVNVDAQYWSRDPGSASTTNLSNGVEFVLCPR